LLELNVDQFGHASLSFESGDLASASKSASVVRKAVNIQSDEGFCTFAAAFGIRDGRKGRPAGVRSRRANS
jgi:hypothetical protein